MDELELSCTWERNSTVTSDKLYCVLRGILLEGCLFKGGKLIENCPEDPPASEAPDCFITWEARSIKSTPVNRYAFNVMKTLKLQMLNNYHVCIYAV